jgi:hypothetical protein
VEYLVWFGCAAVILAFNLSNIVTAWQNGKVRVEQEKANGMLLVEQEKTKQEEFRTERARLEHRSMQAGSDIGATTLS